MPGHLFLGLLKNNDIENEHYSLRKIHGIVMNLRRSIEIFFGDDGSRIIQSYLLIKNTFMNNACILLPQNLFYY